MCALQQKYWTSKEFWYQRCYVLHFLSNLNFVPDSTSSNPNVGSALSAMNEKERLRFLKYCLTYRINVGTDCPHTASKHTIFDDLCKIVQQESVLIVFTTSCIC